MKASEQTVLNFIGGLDKVFVIPPFQRNYEWSEKECLALFNDIIVSAKTKKTHYLGNVVYYFSDNSGASFTELILVDGQQRVTSILLLLCALRDIFVEKGLNEEANSINKRYLKNDTYDNKFRIRLKQTTHDSVCFASIIDGVECEEDNKIVTNYKLFKKLINESDCTPKEIYEAIPKLEIVDVNLQITNDLTAVQTVFEKINSTGKPLEPADLIRNYLLISNSYSEQKSLYDNYWVKIEELIKTENISRFARDYLVMKTFNDVVNDKIYSDFKNHFESEKTLHVEILGDMLKYSKYYSWIKFENSPSPKINKSLLILNLLKTDDLYPLYMYLLEKLYDTNESELIKMLDLLCDFMLRYRIVSPSGGGGALRAAIQRIVELYSEGYCDPTYDTLLFELSNSPTSANRYPTDDEFKEAMKNYINLSNARVLLMRIEEKERYNIPVDITKVTVEHIMPQTRTDWWEDNLGGKEEADRIYETYLNCIGNLAPISQSYNSKNSNKSWDIKRENLRQVQFVITSETANNDQWTEDEIVARNEDVAERAVKAVQGPLKRERAYQSKDPSSTFEAGQYDLSDLQTPMEGASVEELIYDGESIKVDSFKELFYKVCEIAYNFDKEKFAEIVEKNIIHKSTAVKNTDDKDPILTTRPEHLHTAEPLAGTPYFIEGALSSMRIRIYANQLLKEFDGLLEKFKMYLS